MDSVYYDSSTIVVPLLWTSERLQAAPIMEKLEAAVPHSADLRRYCWNLFGQQSNPKDTSQDHNVLPGIFSEGFRSIFLEGFLLGSSPSCNC